MPLAISFNLSPPKNHNKTSDKTTISGLPKLDIFYFSSWEAFRNSLIASPIPFMNSGIFLLPNKSTTTTPMTINSVVPKFLSNLNHLLDS